jgi:tRNA pseudouridine38-40 synthase
MRVKAVIAYDGSAFFGFQRQTSTPQTVTQAIEDALRTLQIDTAVVGSGRTDRYVHATAQVIHFDLPDFWQDLPKLQQILNRRLHAVRLRSLYPADTGFHARFSAKKRFYRYVFKTVKPSVFEEKYLACYTTPFAPSLLKKALKFFEGEHDFRYFQKTGSATHTTLRTIYRARYYTYDNLHIITFEANGFLRSQVRLMVESALQCAQGKITCDALQRQIDVKARYITKPAPPEGLYLARISY